MDLFGSDRVRLVGLGLLIGTFVVGALSGAALERVMSAEEVTAADAETDADAREPDRDRDGDRRSRRYVFEMLDLTESQRAAIDTFLETRRAQSKAIWEEVEPRLDAIIDSTRRDIESVLTPAQRDRYRTLLEERRERRHRDRDRDHEERDRR